jgi:iron complex outermembrane recepter protein
MHTSLFIGARVLPRAAFAALLAAAASLSGQAQAQAQTSVADMSLEELMKINVQTASRKTQRLQEVPAAVFVITRDDISRAGVTSIPEALRLVPGMQVARMASSRWAVSARGFNGRLANKLLVLMDGRSVYSPLFAGVIWENEDTLVEDIDRIEVIRGPGAALWGANAVNGVINIITRKATDTRNNLALVGAGTEERGLLALRKGVGNDSGAVRLWVKAFSVDPSVDLQGKPANDTWRSQRVGFRGDWAAADGNSFMLSGSAYSSPSNDTLNLANVASPLGYTVMPVRQDNSGAHLLARYTWGGATESALQAYIDRTSLNLQSLTRERRLTVDLDFQQRTRALDGDHDIVWGANLRSSSDKIDNPNASAVLNTVSIWPPTRTWNLVSVFAQDDITLVPQTWRAVLGARLEHNSFTGVEVQPNARVMWTPSNSLSVWGALSRAVRTPGRAERGAMFDLAAIPGGPTGIPANPYRPAVLLRSGTGPVDFDSEKVIALELGMRQQLHKALSLDLALFSNRYTDLRGASTGPLDLKLAAVPYLVQTTYIVNETRANAQGLELALDWQASADWRLQAAYTHTRITAGTAQPQDPTAVAAAQVYTVSAPRHQASLRSGWAMTDRISADLWLRYTSALPNPNQASATVPAYTGLDARLAWRPAPGLELSLRGTNLLDKQHAEFTPDLLPSQPLLIERAVYASVKWQF